MSEIQPTEAHLTDPYVLQLIEALSMQQDQLEDCQHDCQSTIREKDEEIRALLTEGEIMREALFKIMDRCAAKDHQLWVIANNAVSGRRE